MKVFVDTSALIALLDEDDRRHDDASAVFRSLAGTAELVTHNYVHVEALAVATRRLGRGAGERLTDAILPIVSIVWVEEALHREALAAHHVATYAASFVDHVSFALMRRLGIELAFAFDPDFELAGFQLASRPAEDEVPRRLSESATPYGDARDERPDLVSIAEIAARSGHPVNTIQSWRRRHADFPAPVVRLAAGPVWNWASVGGWIHRRRSVSRSPTPNTRAQRPSGKEDADAIDDADLAAALASDDDAMLPLPPEWQTTAWGDPMPSVVAAVRRSRAGH
ncbi:MAG TPA: PIN domain-containing protein [Candidatus Limnocylindrales bacterium]|nr:PIN domain-containing protein [Candidatus Limnocylindrales bacterium]